MATRLTESPLYRHLWSTPELDAVFEERARLQSWLDVLAALAAAQAELGIIPEEAARAIARGARVETLDLDLIARETQRSGHSTLGLIQGLRRTLPPPAREYVYYGATVQDLTDTWMGLAIKRVGAFAWSRLRGIEATLLELALRHRSTPMAGRTHGQPGSPITFGLKAASWADEVRRHLERLDQGRRRWPVGQLAGAVGTLAFFGPRGPELRRRFCQRLGLVDPGVAWTTARDRPAEFLHLLAMITATLARVGREIYELQRPEIGELREPSRPEAVGSITMPHKRNPEVSEHLVTLSRLVRAQAAVVLEGMVQEHERDGAGWKAEWAAFPDACLYAGAALNLAGTVLEGLEVDEARMGENLARNQGYLASERVLAVLAPRLGKHRAQELLQDALGQGRRRGLPLEAALREADALRPYLDREVEGLVAGVDVGAAAQMVDEVVGRARRARAAEAEEWP
ncbi:MAG TPA: adenylosuccinate lyase family protein [Candidatus Dormibacteraeota bacterium]|nr:adenylosuccinate lyase family protein [Candidatus Dormibacteraeota bacterium]